MFLSFRSSIFNDRTYKSRKKPLESGPSRRAFKLGYLCHFVKLLSDNIYVERVYARGYTVSNLLVDNGGTTAKLLLFLGFFEDFGGFCEVARSVDLDPIGRKNRLQFDPKSLGRCNDRLG